VRAHWVRRSRRVTRARVGRQACVSQCGGARAE